MKGLNVKKLMKSVNSENVVIGVLVVILVILVVVYVKQNNEGFDAHEPKPELKFYMTPWCGYCKQAKANVFDAFKSDKVTLVTINCVEEKKLHEEDPTYKDKCSAASIEGYPTLVLNGETFQGSASDPDAVYKFIADNT